jgi:excisionase family DNA binding protein
MNPIGQFRPGDIARLNPRHPLIKKLVALRLRDRVPRQTLAERSGHSECKISRWEYETREPGLFAFEDTLKVMGYKLAVVPEDSSRGQGADADVKDAKNWLRTTEVARRLGISVETMNKKIHGGVLPATRVGRLWLIHERDLDGYLRAHSVAERSRL